MYETNNFNVMPEQKNIEMPMKWYNFLIYFLLYFLAVINVYGAINIVTGRHLGNSDIIEFIYSLYPSLKSVDFIMGICLFLLSIACIITRQKLKKFSQLGPKFLLAIFAFDLLIAFIYLIFVAVTTDIELNILVDSSFIKTVLQSTIMIIANNIYFKKREHLFVY